MAKNDIAEETKAAHKGNVDDKVNKGDKPQKLTGEIDVVNKKPHLNYDDKLPDYSAATTKDKSKSSKVSTSPSESEQKGTMNNMPMVKKLDEGDESEDEAEELTEEEIAQITALRTSIMESLVERLADYIPTDDKPVDMTEHVNVLFEGSELSDEFKSKAKTVFEAAVHAEVTNTLAAILEASTDMIIENDMALTEAYDEKINDTLSTFAESWAEANMVGIQSRLKTEITEDFIHGLTKLMQDHNIMLPEDKVDVVEAMADEVITLKDQLNEQIKVNIDLSTQLNEHLKNDVVDALAEGLTDTQATKLKSLCESIGEDDDFEAKAIQIKESYFGGGGKAKTGKGLTDEETVLTESEVNTEAKLVTEQATKVSQTVNALSRFARR